MARLRKYKFADCKDCVNFNHSPCLTCDKGENFEEKPMKELDFDNMNFGGGYDDRE